MTTTTKDLHIAAEAAVVVAAKTSKMWNNYYYYCYSGQVFIVVRTQTLRAAIFSFMCV